MTTRKAKVCFALLLNLEDNAETIAGRFQAAASFWTKGGLPMSFSVLMLCFLIGCVAGLRSMMAPAIVCAGAYMGWLKLVDTPLRFLTYRWVMSVLVLLAILELISDKLPKTPARTAPVGLCARAVTGAFSGAAVALGAQAGVSALVGAVLGLIGGIASTYAGYYIRRELVSQMKLPDFVVAVVEDLLTISGGLFVVSRL
jgi:uncharacterized membrane protein